MEAVSSVQKSVYKNFEIILVDDGSTDNSKKICKALDAHYTNIHFFSFHKNKGLGRVLNFALKKAKGRYICRINQDDIMMPQRLKVQVAYLQKYTDVILLGSWLRVEYENGDIRINKFLETDTDIKASWLYLSPCWDASVMYRKKDALAIGGYDQKYWPADDLHMWYRLGKRGNMANIQQPLVTIRFHASAASLKHHKEHLIQTYKVHRFAHKNIEYASLLTQTFWIAELMAGYVFPPRFNWYMYRLIKKYLVYPLSHVQKTVKRAHTARQFIESLLPS